MRMIDAFPAGGGRDAAPSSVRSAAPTVHANRPSAVLGEMALVLVGAAAIVTLVDLALAVLHIS
jgi:hypothetical protein